MVIVRVIAFGIKRHPYVLNGVKLTLIILMFQMVYARVEYCHQNDLQYILVICQLN